MEKQPWGTVVKKEDDPFDFGNDAKPAATKKNDDPFAFDFEGDKKAGNEFDFDDVPK